MSTKQELFDEMAKAVIAQGQGSFRLRYPQDDTTGGIQCLYDDGKGHHCGIGLLVKARDEQMLKMIANRADPVEMLPFGAYDPIMPTDENVNGIRFLRELQGAHDRACHYKDFVEAFKTQMKNVASAYCLSAASVL